MTDDNILQLLTATLQTCVCPEGKILSVAQRPMPGVGYSGAELRRYAVEYAASSAGEAQQVELVVKDASLIERRVLVHLYHQGQAAIPYCCTLDLEGSRPAALCMEYLEVDREAESAKELEHTAQAVAAIHAANLCDPALQAWLPPADGAFVESGYVLGTFRAAWAQALGDGDFEQEYGALTADLESAGQRFQRDVEALWQEGMTTTLIHGDLHDGNVVYRAGQPYLIDWAHARYGSLYLDLPNLFPGEAARLYYEALWERGVAIDQAEFFERYQRMGRYVGFKYLGFTLAQWAGRDTPGSLVREHLENLIDLALNGA
jgi:thiamine kinase-like enzyme